MTAVQDLRAPAGVAWKLFALLFAMLTIIDIATPGSAPGVHPAVEPLRLASYAIAAVGVLAFAWNLPARPLTFWRLFAPLYCFVTAAVAGQALPMLVIGAIRIADSVLGVVAVLVVVVPVVAMLWLSSAALLRFADLIGPSRRPFGSSPPLSAQLELPLG